MRPWLSSRPCQGPLWSLKTYAPAISDIMIMKNREASTVPCGTPDNDNDNDVLFAIAYIGTYKS